LIHPQEPPIGVFDEEIDIWKHVKQLAQVVLRSEKGQKSVLEVFPLGNLSGMGFFAAHLHGTLKRTRRAEYTKCRDYLPSKKGNYLKK
jgi:hypothetical protein